MKNQDHKTTDEQMLSHSLLESTLKTLKEVGKSQDISALLSEIEITEPGLLQDFLIELSLTANPNEEDGVGCYPLAHIERAYKEFKETGDTKLLNVLKE